jgi:uncharacterized protein YbaP (TraB family)
VLNRRLSFAALLLAGASLGCATGQLEPRCAIPSAPTRPAPLLWRAEAASEGGGLLYLFGSVHVGAEATPQLTGEIHDAYEESDELVVEVEIDDVAVAQIAAGLAVRGRLEPPKQLGDVLSAQTLELLVGYLKQRELELSMVEGLKPWFVTHWIVALELQSAGYESEYGIDRYFVEKSQGVKPVVALESAQQQIDLLDGLPLQVQEIMLRDALDRSSNFDTATDQMIRAWQRGDERALEQLVFQPVEDNSDFEAFYETIFYERNFAMSEKLLDLSRDGKTRFVVLGAGHMLGPRGIPSVLCTNGFSVRRISGGGTGSPQG